jgi:hypothetical protein
MPIASPGIGLPGGRGKPILVAINDWAAQAAVGTYVRRKSSVGVDESGSVGACRPPGVSVSAVTLARGFNANQ